MPLLDDGGTFPHSGRLFMGDDATVELVPAAAKSQRDWDDTAGELARDLGWTERCAGSGAPPACPVKAAIQWIGYDGYPSQRFAPDVRRRLPGASPRVVGVGVLPLERSECDARG